MNAFLHHVEKFTGHAQLHGRSLETIQVNLGLRCNMACSHCHLQASPQRKESMTQAIMEQILSWLATSTCRRLDITGGAPELHPQFRWFISQLHALNKTIQVRTNLTIYQEPRMAEVATFLRDMQVGLVGSLPCYLEKNVDGQRGVGTFQRSLDAIRFLNTLGYGIHPQWPLDLVYNPGGPYLPPDQTQLEQIYHQWMEEKHGLFFTRLLAITNMPIGRFQADLRRQGQENAYMTVLHNAFNPQTLDGLMCRNQISIRWDGELFDCDFNLALNRPLMDDRRCVKELSHDLALRAIVTGNHCLACTAGAGSSCSGTLVGAL